MVFCCFAPQEPASPPTAGRSQAASVQREPEPTVAQEPEKVALPAVQPAPAPQEPVLPPAGQTEDAGRAGSFSRGSLPTQLSQILAGVPAAGVRSNDLWTNLAKCADSLVGSLSITASSFYIFTTSRRFCKVIPNTASPMTAALRKSGWELCHAAETPSAAQVTGSRTPSYFQVPRASPTAHPRAVPSDFQLLHTQAGCQAFLILPLYQGHTVVGALMLAHTEPIPTLADHRWLAAYLPLLSLYLTETSALKLVNFTEKIQTAFSLNQLAWIVSSELDTWFDWCHPDDTEARLVLLAPDQSAAMVLSRSVGTLRAFDPVNSIDVLVSGGVRSGSAFGASASGVGRRSSANMDPDAAGGIRRDASFASRQMLGGGLATTVTGGKPVPDEGLLGTHMSLSNTLTRRCLAEGSKLLFVADVMAALKKYGEPWKDVFMEQARVTNPTWVVAAPIAHGGRHLGAILWLSSSRLNPNMLAQTAKASVPLLLHTVARQVVHLIQQVSSAAGAGMDDPTVFWSQLLALPHLNMLSGATATGLANGGGGTGHLDTADMASSLGNSMVGGGMMGGQGREHGGSGHSDALTGGGILTGAPTDTSASRQLRYTVMVRSDSVSTSALVRAYQTAIAQHQRASAASSAADVGSAYEEIQVIAKAGQGAFGSVYVALWKGLVVAVKVMRQQAEGRRAMRTAWELAVTKSVSHPNIVMVYATFTDVVVVKLSKRLIRFVPAATTLAEPGSTGGGAASADGSGQAGAGTSDAGARCQVIIMEYCNLGPLHHYVAERRYAQQLGNQQAEKERVAAAAAVAAHRASRSGNASANAAAAAAAAEGNPASGGDVAAAATGQPASGENGGGGSGTANGGSPPPTAPGGGPSSGHGAAVAAAALGHSTTSGSGSGCLPAGAVTGPVEFGTTLATLLEVASALQYLHSLGFIHCDLKPENVLLKASPGDPRGFTIKVSDFGLSELLTSDGPLMGELGGTVTHIAPEIVTHKRVTKAADAYAFGVVMWELLTGNRLYSDLFTSGREKRVRDKLILAKVAHEGLRPVFPDATPHEYAHLARRCWTADPTMRPTFTEILQELEHIQRRYCKAVSSLPGLENIMAAGGGGSAAAAQAAAQAQAQQQHQMATQAAALAAAGGASQGLGGVTGPTSVGAPSPGGAGGNGSSAGVPAGANAANGSTAPLPQQRGPSAHASGVRATADVAMAVSPLPRGAPGGQVAPGAGAGAAAGHNSGGHAAAVATAAARVDGVNSGNSGNGTSGPQYGGGSSGGAAGASGASGGGGGVPQGGMRAGSAHGPLHPSPLRQVSTARMAGEPGKGGSNGGVAADTGNAAAPAM
ncbi:hypothetical protein CHLRE_08g379500v5 [Chlamydomonas reinhardtii]|uniref:Protein kinase domain-containing protein n=1 Tax=Chlamydomonas reinhardtii TaxID=3055 RepID=A0A2K3DHY5_CHLRE|nr:uncharacterized protein CHLRE_08g379500v5 [Chlamydomonas reinhardtii]PNW80138.1 hypothetical protein CHLRE_08g379500v5 [Chlamydomonas reinhardtii]